ncbi:hypothetical protein L3X38_020067 [Prunus dulcis]|uniref:Uncharacterized protein n=1 Tax=Prunus dulcis TaxID=3755 RepID=A0AAD4ZD51_PRUDU|nr:hypothetical protein L3X38_020067 [Prunus dulcis]
MRLILDGEDQRRLSLSIDRTRAISFSDAKTDAGVVDVGLVLDKHNMQVFASLFTNIAFSSRKVQAISDDFDGKEEATRSLSYMGSAMKISLVLKLFFLEPYEKTKEIERDEVSTENRRKTPDSGQFRAAPGQLRVGEERRDRGGADGTLAGDRAEL